MEVGNSEFCSHRNGSMTQSSSLPHDLEHDSEIPQRRVINFLMHHAIDTGEQGI